VRGSLTLAVRGLALLAVRCGFVSELLRLADRLAAALARFIAYLRRTPNPRERAKPGRKPRTRKRRRPDVQ
jgi:hypothetical protein